MTTQKTLVDDILEEIDQGISDYSTKSADLESYIDLFTAERSEKNYDWNSNLFIPEMPAHINTQLSMDVNQYFSTRDFVETYLQDKSPQALASADAAKECINRTLNQRRLFHYAKFCRSKLFTYLNGSVYARCWWEKDVEYIDENGKVVENNAEQNLTKNIKEDRFMYDILDPRQVIASPEFAYSPQDKRWIAIWSETTLSELEDDETIYNYENMDEVKKLVTKTSDSNKPVKTQTATLKEHSENIQEHLKSFIKYDWYGKHFVIVEERDHLNRPISGRVGTDATGQPLENAELLEVMITIAKHVNGNVLLRFNLSPYSDFSGRAFRPILRTTCYFHPTEDEGVGDGLYDRDLQIGINDSYNLGNDRLYMATIPTLITKRYMEESDDMDIYVAPGHVMVADNPKEDIAELPISDNIVGTLSNVAFLTQKMQQSDSIHAPQLGGLPAASNTATAIADTASKSDIRANYKSMNYEYSFLLDMYWMILQMTYAFAEDETAIKLIGEDKVYDFDPSLDYFYKPLSQSIESDASKFTKIDKLNTTLGYVAPSGNVRVMNAIIAKIGSLMGEEIEQITDMLLDEGDKIAGDQQGTEQAPVSNEQGIPQSIQERSVRGK